MIESLYEKGKAFFEQGRLEEALDTLLSHVRQDPQDIDAYHILAQIFWQTGKSNQALELLRGALESDPSHSAIRQTLAEFEAMGAPSVDITQGFAPKSKPQVQVNLGQSATQSSNSNQNFAQAKQGTKPQVEQSLNRYDLIDLSLLKNQRVMNFGFHVEHACVKAQQSGASEVCGVEGLSETSVVSQSRSKSADEPNFQHLQIDFNSTEFYKQIEDLSPGKTDYAFFFSVYRKKELIQREVLFQYIIEKTQKGIFFEGHAEAEIDTLKYHDWLFECYGLPYQFLGYTESNNLRPLFYLDVANRIPRPGQKDLYLLLGDANVKNQIKATSGEADYLVSAIVSTYNSEAFIEARLENLVNQSLGQRLEIVVIDSNSPQDEKSIIERYQAKHSNIKFLRTVERETVYQAWNRGIKMAQGKYVTNANTDDLLRHDALEVLAMTLENQPQFDLAYGDFHITHLPNQTFENHIRIGYSRKPDFHPNIMLTGCHMGPQPLWRRSLHAQYGYFDEELKAAGDYEFWCRLASNGNKFIHVPEFLGLYLHNLDGICNSNTTRVVGEARLVKQKYQNAFPPYPYLKGPEDDYYKENISSDNHYVNVCMITYNRLDFTKQTLDSFIANTKYPHVLTVVDNNSTDGSREYLLQKKKEGVIHNLILLDENVGVAKASNLAWQVEPNAEYYLKLDNDIVIQKDNWLGDMVKTLETIPEIGVLGYNFEPKTYPIGEKNGVQVQIKENGNIGGAVQMIPKRTSQKLGRWCEEYGFYGEEDADYGVRSKVAGMLNAYMMDNEMGFHLPAGKAAVIDKDSWLAEDGKEENQDREYRLWKDAQRKSNMGPDGRFPKNVVGYKSGTRSLFVKDNFAAQCLSVLNEELLEDLRTDFSGVNQIFQMNQLLKEGKYTEAMSLLEIINNPKIQEKVKPKLSQFG